MVAHVFVDAENISPSVTFGVVEYFGKEHTITKVDIIAKEDTLPYRYRDLDENLYRVQNCFYGKNSADTWLCLEMVRAIIDEPDLELIIIVSSDKDFLPAIKFAADFDKKIVIVSNGAGHKALAEHLQNLNVNPEAVELKDFRLNFGGMPEQMERFLPHMSFYTKKYFFDREERIKFIFVKKDEKLFEVPFVPGMTAILFRQLLIELNILGKRDSIKEFVAQNFLKLNHDRVYFRTEAEISIPTHAEQVEFYFAEHAAESRTIFIKHNGKLFEIPFVDGLPLSLFKKILHNQKIIGKNSSLKKIAANSLLEIRDDRVFLLEEDELEAAQDDLEISVDDYLNVHALEIQTVMIRRDDKKFSIPFVNGMPLKIFGKLLREREIIDKKILPEEIAADNSLIVHGERIFCREEEAT